MAAVTAHAASQSRAAPVNVCQKNQSSAPHTIVATANGMNVSQSILGWNAFASARTNDRSNSFMRKPVGKKDHSINQRRCAAQPGRTANAIGQRRWWASNGRGVGIGVRTGAATSAQTRADALE